MSGCVKQPVHKQLNGERQAHTNRQAGIHAERKAHDDNERSVYFT